MKYRYVLFDLDGTLTDPKVGITKSIQYALGKNDIEEVSLNELEKFIGPPLKESFVEFYSFDEQTAMTAIEYYREYFKEKGIFQNDDSQLNINNEYIENYPWNKLNLYENFFADNYELSYLGHHMNDDQVFIMKVLDNQESDLINELEFYMIYEDFRWQIIDMN